MDKPALPIDLCTACGACVSSCNKDAVVLTPNEEGFYYPVIDEMKCVGCKQCERACHVLNLSFPRVCVEAVNAYMLKAKELNIVKQSSSGGVFSLLANKILKKGGCVYGAAYDYENELLKCSSTDECSLDCLKKSKYIESYMGNSFRKIEQNLKENRLVLFCGTSCQCRGLRSYLKMKKISEEKLLMVRFICHGVPSNKFFSEYKHWMEHKYKSKVLNVDFRPKTFGWRNQSMSLFFSNGRKYLAPHTFDPYLTCFYKSASLRKTCFSCEYEKQDFADLTIGDFWGIHFYRPENKDQEGISVVLTHNEKGMAFLNEISNECFMESLPSAAVEYLFKERNYFEAERNRNNFMKKVSSNGYMSTVFNLYGQEMKMNKIRWYLSRMKNFIFQ